MTHTIDSSPGPGSGSSGALLAGARLPAAIASLGTPLLVVLGAIWCVTLGAIWPYEEPDKVATIIAMIAAYGCGIAVVRVAYRFELIERPDVWTLAFLGKFTLSVAILGFLWMRPLVGVDLVRTSTQIPGLLTDSNFYDYLADRVAKAGFAESRTLLFATWQSVGIVAYGAAIYKLFGVSTLYVSAFNVVLALLAAVSLTGILRALAPERSRFWNLGWVVLFLPVETYYDSMLSKEPLTNAFFYLALLAAARLYAEVGRARRNAMLYAIAVVLLTALRPNASLLALVTPLALLIRGRHALRRTLAAGFAFALALGVASLVADPVAIISDVANVATLSERTQLLIEQKADEGDAGLKQGVSALVSPRGSLLDIPLAPLRAVIWNYVPFPILLPRVNLATGGEEMLWRDWNRYFKTWIEVMRVLSAFVLIVVTPWVVVALRRPARSVSGFMFLASNTIVPLLVMSNVMFVQGSRYRSLLEPLFLGLAGWGAQFGSRPPRLLVYSSFAFVILLYEMLTA
jgi:hypothetical protein